MNSIDRDQKHFNLFSVKGKYDPYLCSSEIHQEVLELTINKNKLPVIILLPLVIALLIYLIYYVRYPNFITGFYTFASCFFIFLLLLPTLNNLFIIYKDRNKEKRVLAERPIFDEN